MGDPDRPQSASIHVLSDHPLLKILLSCRPVFPDQDKVDNTHIVGARKWSGSHWWYKFAHVCRRWRYLVLESASHLDLYLLCTYNTPVAEMLAYSPPLPLVVDYGDEDREVTTQDEKGISLALQRRRRVRHIRLCIPSSSLRKLLVAISGEFPILAYLGVNPLNNDGQSLTLPETFKAPHLRHLALGNVTYSPGMSRLLPPLGPFKSVETIGQCARHCGTQLWRYAFTCYVYQSLSKQDSRATDH